MEKLVIFAFLLTINTWLQCASSAPESSQAKLELPNLQLGKDVLVSFKNVFNGVAKDEDITNLNQKIATSDNQRPLETLALLFIFPVAAQHPEIEPLEDNYVAMLQLIENINRDYGYYLSYQKLKKDASDPSVRRFAQSATGPYRSPSAKMDGVYALLFPRHYAARDDSIVPEIMTKLKGYDIYCDQSMSQQQVLQTILTGIGVLEFKVFLLTEYSYRILSKKGEVDYNKEMIKVRETFRQRFTRLITEFERNMAQASREIWTCAPEEYKEGQNYFQMNAFQSYVVRDSEFKEEKYYSCAGSCHDYKKTKQVSCSNKEEYWDSDPGFEYYEYSICATTKRRCEGQLYDCIDKFDAYSELWICPSDDNSTRRYEYMVYGNIGLFSRDLRRYGDPNNNKVCHRKYSYDYRSFDPNFKICEVCLCTCQETESPTSDQKINVRPIVADKNHVITGIRWIKKNHILTLQVEQGKFVNGELIADTVHWKDTSDPRGDMDVRVFDWQIFRGFYLQNVELTKDELLVGVRLKDMPFANRKLVVIQLLAATFNKTTGKLMHGLPFYKFPDQSAKFDVWEPSPKTLAHQQLASNDAVDLGERRLPTDFKDEAVVVNSKKFVQLTTSDFPTDLGQNTVPYFEMANIVADPPVPLTGIGMYVKKNNKDSGGILALKGFTADNSAFVKQEV